MESGHNELQRPAGPREALALSTASDEERQAVRFELFFDLLYVAIAASFSDDLAEYPDAAHLAKYVLTSHQE
ncbi:low temperature requirement protein A [Microdochium nivale]|nr:low temperature requirement protein A [Microdochium nivale]